MKILAFLKTEPNIYVGNATQTRRFVAAILWIVRSGSQWRLLPAAYGRWNSIHKRFARRQRLGVWQRRLEHLAAGPDLENIMLDSTTVRARPCAAGARKSDGGQVAQALGRSAGGFSTKIHMCVDGLGNPLRVHLSAGQRHDISQVPQLIADLTFAHAIADCGYPAEPFIALIRAHRAEPVIPPYPRAHAKRAYDTWRYRERHLVECFINKIKHFRRAFSRFDKLAARFLGGCHGIRIDGIVLSPRPGRVIVRRCRHGIAALRDGLGT